MEERFCHLGQNSYQPLATRIRPRFLSEYIGQSHLLAKGKLLAKVIERGQVHSMILCGPPGTGKTTLAEIIVAHSQSKIERLSAASSGVKEVRDIIELAKVNQHAGIRTVLFIDEIHRFNRNQQDSFLPFIESGLITLIGATTENPSFALNAALLSRVRVYLLKSLTDEEIEAVLTSAMSDEVRGYGRHSLVLLDETRRQIAQFANGDARSALNVLELLVEVVEESEHHILTPQHLKKIPINRNARFDNKGDRYYDLISAVHKSIRGSSPDAALYWYARIIAAGGDPLYVARRLLAIASEDIGNADPRAMQVALAGWQCFTYVGPEEGERAIAQAVVYLACAAKSNALYRSFKDAMQDAKTLPDYDVPAHLCNAPTSLMRAQGKGEGYRYVHDETHAYAAGEDYFPPELSGRRYYFPVDRGVEKQYAEKLAWLRTLDKKSNCKRY